MSSHDLRKFRLTYASGFCIIIAVEAIISFLIITSHLWPLYIIPVLMVLITLRFYSFYSNLWKITDKELSALLIKRGYEPFSFRSR